MKRLVALISLLTLNLGGCGSKFFNEEFNNSEIILGRDYAPPGSKYYPRPLYCYKTLAGAECFNDPQPDQARRFIAAYSPAPPKKKAADEWWWDTPIKEAPEEHSAIQTKPLPLGSSSPY